MEEIDLDHTADNTYALTTIPEIKIVIDEAGSFIDIWFPHVSKKIVCSWGTQDFREYVNTLFYTTRNTTRQGFPLEVLTELSVVVELHQKLFPQYEPVKSLYL